MKNNKKMKLQSVKIFKILKIKFKINKKYKIIKKKINKITNNWKKIKNRKLKLQKLMRK